MRLQDAALQAAGYPSARAYFKHVGKLVDDLTSLTRYLMFGVEGVERKTYSSVKPLVKDPTAAEALAHQAALKQIEELEEKRKNLQIEIGTALVLLDGIRHTLGHKQADVLELHYIDRFTWAQIAGELGISARQAIRQEQITFDWIDSHGWQAIVTGKGVAE